MSPGWRNRDSHRATRRHILAFEKDNEIFTVIITPQMRKTVVNRAKPPPTTPDSFDLEEEGVEPERVVMTNLFSKFNFQLL